MGGSRLLYASIASKRATHLGKQSKAQLLTRSIASYTHSSHADQISIIKSVVDTSSTEYQENKSQMEQAIARIRELKAKAADGGSAKAREKHIQRGKMLPRE
jgi:3-methylcrotonyl-CoA carboxylase beta subunit